MPNLCYFLWAGEFLFVAWRVRKDSELSPSNSFWCFCRTKVWSPFWKKTDIFMVTFMQLVKRSHQSCCTKKDTGMRVKWFAHSEERGCTENGTLAPVCPPLSSPLAHITLAPSECMKQCTGSCNTGSNAGILTSVYSQPKRNWLCNYHPNDISLYLCFSMHITFFPSGRKKGDSFSTPSWPM